MHRKKDYVHVLSSERSFQLLSSNDIARGPYDALGSVKGTQSIHSLLFDNGKTRARDMSCFCNTCLLGESGVCCNRNFVSDWKVVSVHNVKIGPTSSGIKQKSKKRELTALKSNPMSNVYISSSQPASKHLVCLKMTLFLRFQIQICLVIPDFHISLPFKPNCLNASHLVNSSQLLSRKLQTCQSFVSLLWDPEG